MKRYRNVKRKGVTYLEHRHVWEQEHGPIPEGYVVHHRNNDGRDNRLENLELMTHQEHSQHHNQKHAIVRDCDVCETPYEPHPTKRARSRTCSDDCFRALMARQKRGVENPHAKLNPSKVKEARERKARGEKLAVLCEDYGVSPASMSNAINGVTWAHVE